MVIVKNVKINNLERSLNSLGFSAIYGEPEEIITEEMTKKDLKRAFKLGRRPANSGENNFLSGIDVAFDIKYSQYFSMQLQRYHFLQIVGSQSKMYTISKRDSIKEYCNKYVDDKIITLVNEMIVEFNKTKKYEDYMRIISNLPMGFEMWMDCRTNYLQLKNIYLQRKEHKLKEDWGTFCDFIINLPYFKELTGV
jgi:hypothetical protein